MGDDRIFESAALRALDASAASGAGYADIRFEQGRAERIEVRNGVVAALTDATSAVRQAAAVAMFHFLDLERSTSAYNVQLTEEAQLELVERIREGKDRPKWLTDLLPLLDVQLKAAEPEERLQAALVLTVVAQEERTWPILVASANARGGSAAQSDPTTVTQMLRFVAGLFDRLLPALQLFKPTQITDAPVPFGDMVVYSGQVMLYALLYTGIVLLFGLVLFEDRDLA